MKRFPRFVALPVCLAAVLLVHGCVERRFTVRSEPTGALLILDGEQIGPTPQTIDFVFYGTRSIMLKKDGYKTHKAFEDIPAPLYERFPIDFFAEFFWPGTIVDEKTFTYTLRPAEPFNETEFLNRARAVRKKANTEP